MFYQEFVGYGNINYICDIDSHRKQYAMNQFFSKNGTDTERYTAQMIENFFRKHEIRYKSYFWLDDTRTEDVNMRMFGIYLGQSWLRG